uniref:t-SNARE coiled-coil homology domain-containing protein n=1 Tax=Lutzomyia longipalpis TaxID=7200 RepID=A0A1B0F074_LUTLO
MGPQVVLTYPMWSHSAPRNSYHCARMWHTTLGPSSPGGRHSRRPSRLLEHRETINRHGIECEHQVQMSTNQKVTATSKDLQRLAAIVRGGDKQQKLQVEKLTSDFKIVVEKYSNSQQQIATKMKASLLMNASQMDDLEGGGSGGVEAQQLLQAQRTQQAQLQFEQEILVERETRVREIESAVLDVNQIMRDLNVLVSQQGEVVDTIEGSIENTRGNVEEGTSELMKAAESQAKYRKKVLILLIIAVIIGLIVTGIIVARLKS